MLKKIPHLGFIIVSLLALIPQFGVAQTRDTLPNSDSIQRIESSSDTLIELTVYKFPLWFIGSLGLDVAEPSGIGDDMDPWAYDFKIGATWYNRIFLFTDHATHGLYQGDPFESHRYDYALMYGISQRRSFSIGYAAVGLSFVDYRKNGNVISGLAETPDGYIYQEVNGTALGLAVTIEVYITPIPYWGIFGFGLYGSILKDESYLSVDFTFPLEFNIPVWFVK